MHGPTFMGNPLACAAANASLELLLNSDWKSTIHRLEKNMFKGLLEAKELDQVADVRVLGGIGVVELKQAVSLQTIQKRFVEAGIWVRPFGKLVYIIPPLIINDEDLAFLCQQLIGVVRQYCK